MTLSTVPPPDVLLPAYPTLLQGLHVLERGGGEIQIGLDPRHGVVAGRLEPSVVELVRRLDGRRHLDTLLAESEHLDQLRLLLKQLTALGLVTEAPTPTAKRVETGFWSLRARHHQTALTERRRQSLVTVRGDGRIAVAVAVLLANAGIGHIDVRASGTVGEADLGSGLTTAELGVPHRRAVLNVLARVAPDVTTGRNHHRTPDVVILTDALVPAPELVAELVDAGVPHLPAKVRDGTPIVGPLVVPGRSACLRCCDLHRTDLDAAWPRLASQLVDVDQRPDLGAVQSCAALAVAQALRVLSPSTEPPPSWNSTMELDAFEGRLRHRYWEPHPDCDCGAPAPPPET
ncbi:hypothetical protein [Amycolatopsis sp. FDAARGOS 1241]|uniref:hypothetical protein n=1 Tax=Amycolatopsis sp. FDAARGOS 1241 TaxID=2778070 RepID=UPI00194FE4B2|nr:hypothetical protein [Amycolatopsis sp. FDAARGOS 1241]QRP44934.1 hypothetical protein I6J71_37945 [Amycolatopsis sp. FDAARGOS 1241]